MSVHLQKITLLRKIFFVLLVKTYISLPSALAVDGIYLAGAKQAGMANASTATINVWNNFHNQAGLGFLDYSSIGFYHEQRFLESALNQNSLALAVPFGGVTFGFNATFLGFSKYNEGKFGLALAKSLGQYVSIGLQLDYFTSYIEGLDNGGNFTFEGGILTRPAENVFLEFYLFNPTRQTVTQYSNEELPSFFSAGIGTLLDEVLELSVKVEKEYNQEPNLRAGACYFLLPTLPLSLGYASYPRMFSAGAGYYFPKWHFNLSFSSIQPHGFTPQFSLTYVFK